MGPEHSENIQIDTAFGKRSERKRSGDRDPPKKLTDQSPYSSII